MSKLLSDEEILNLIAIDEKRKILFDIKEIDEKVLYLNIEVPASLEKKINFLGLYPKTLKRKKIFYKKAAIFILAVFMSGELLFNPKAILAIKQIIFQMVSYQNKESLNISFCKADNNINNFEFYLPNGFELSSQVDNFNTQRFVYKNQKGKYIIINTYPENFTLAIDNENYEQYEEIELNGYIGKLIIKSDVISIIFSNGDVLFDLESNLPKDDFLAVAKSINIKN